MRVDDLAARLEATFEGDAAVELRGAAMLDAAGPLELAFAAAPKFYESAARSQAGCILVPLDYPTPANGTVIRVKNVRGSFARAISWMFPRRRPESGVHPSAAVHPTAHIAPGSFIGAHATVAEHARIGDGVEIGDDVEIGANTCIDRAALGVTRIGDGVKLDNQVHIGHNCTLGNHVVIAAQTGMSGGVTVGDYAIIGGQVGIGDKARIESKAVLGSGCGILTSKIVRGGQVVWGTPARPLKQYLEQLANLARLPELRKEVAALRKQVKES